MKTPITVTTPADLAVQIEGAGKVFTARYSSFSADGLWKVFVGEYNPNLSWDSTSAFADADWNKVKEWLQEQIEEAAAEIRRRQNLEVAARNYIAAMVKETSSAAEPVDAN